MIILEDRQLSRDAGPVYFWMGNVYPFASGDAGSDVRIQAVTWYEHFNRFVLDLKTPFSIFEYQSNYFQYLLQGVDPEWRTLMKLKNTRVPILLNTANLSDIETGLVHIEPNKDKEKVINMVVGYYNLHPPCDDI